ncbi:helix-turn-helix domain-containing protein [Celeribacter sp.]|uniref:helix-turn-helix domain-containing protein n=1 Tax=Celeribacter sp. TaxID=1890673 RepID=UPI003A930EB1
MKLRIKELRTAAGLSVQALADKAGLSRSYLNEIENGKKTINARRLETIARALSVRPADLIENTDESPEFKEIIETFRAMSPENRALVLNLARSLADRD